MFLDTGTMDGHSIVGWIPRSSDRWETSVCQILSTILWSILNLTKMTPLKSSSFCKNRLITMLFSVHLLYISSVSLFSFWWSSPFEVVAKQLFCSSCGYVPHVCRNGEWWINWNAAQIPQFTKSCCSLNYTQSGWDWSISYYCKLCSNNSEVLDIEWAAAGIYIGCPDRGK